MRNLLQDLRYGMRGLVKNPGFTLVVTLILGLAIGANSVLFSFVNLLLLRKLPIQEIEQVAFIEGSNAQQGAERLRLSPADFLDYRERSKSLEGLAAYTLSSATLTGRGEPELLTTGLTTASFFRDLGAARRAGPHLQRGRGPGRWRGRGPAEPWRVDAQVRRRPGSRRSHPDAQLPAPRGGGRPDPRDRGRQLRDDRGLAPARARPDRRGEERPAAASHRSPGAGRDARARGGRGRGHRAAAAAGASRYQRRIRGRRLARARVADGRAPTAADLHAARHHRRRRPRRRLRQRRQPRAVALHRAAARARDPVRDRRELGAHPAPAPRRRRPLGRGRRDRRPRGRLGRDARHPRGRPRADLRADRRRAARGAVRGGAVAADAARIRRLACAPRAARRRGKGAAGNRRPRGGRRERQARARAAGRVAAGARLCSRDRGLAPGALGTRRDRPGLGLRHAAARHVPLRPASGALPGCAPGAWLPRAAARGPARSARSRRGRRDRAVADPGRRADAAARRARARGGAAGGSPVVRRVPRERGRARGARPAAAARALVRRAGRWGRRRRRVARVQRAVLRRRGARRALVRRLPEGRRRAAASGGGWRDRRPAPRELHAAAQAHAVPADGPRPCTAGERRAAHASRSAGSDRRSQGPDPKRRPGPRGAVARAPGAASSRGPGLRRGDLGDVRRLRARRAADGVDGPLRVDGVPGESEDAGDRDPDGARREREGRRGDGAGARAGVSA